MQIRASRQLLKKLHELSVDGDIDLWAMDEVHFQQYGSSCRMWIPPEVKHPILLHKPTRKSVGYFGAVRLRDGKFTYRREDEKFNAETFLIFLRQLRCVSSRSARKVVVILDNARYHHARLHKDWREMKSDCFEMLYLPPYSPELNPVERVWKMTRRKATHNRYFSSLEDVSSAVEDTFISWRPPNDILRKLCAI